MNTVASLAGRLDRPLATTIVASEDLERRWIGQALLTAAALYLLKQYASGFLEGAGFKDLAKEHGRRAREFLAHLRKGELSDEEIRAEAAETEELLRRLPKSTDRQAQARALQKIKNDVMEMGALRSQAEQLAKDLEALVGQQG